MSKIKTPEETGWINTYTIIQKNRMPLIHKCHKCKKRIRGNSNCVLRERTNWKHRGNETDEAYLYHFKCSPKKNIKDMSKIKKEADRRVKLFYPYTFTEYEAEYAARCAIIMTEHLISATLYDKPKNHYEGLVLEELKSRT
jgi:hypothetical protein